MSDKYVLADTSKNNKLDEQAREIEKDDKKLSMFIMIYYFFGVTNIVIKLNLSIGIIVSLSSKIFMLMIIGCMLYGIPVIIKRSVLPMIICELFLLFLYVLSFLYGNAGINMLKSKIFTSVCICAPLLVYVYSIKNLGVLYNMLKKYSYICIPISFISILSFSDEMTYSMSISTYLMIFIMIQLNEALKTKKTINIIYAISGAVYIMTYSNRGSLICIAVFFAVTVARNSDDIVKKFLLLAVILLLALIYTFYLDDILKVLIKILTQLNIKSYTLSQFIDGSFFESDSRLELFNHYIGLVKQKPLLGWGILGGYISEALGPHNTLIEFFLAFGIIFGFIISATFIFMIVRSYFCPKNSDIASDLVIIYSAMNITMLISAGEFLIKPNFYVFIALFLRKFVIKQHNVAQ